MLDAFADKARLVTMLNRCLAGEGVRVLIGNDNELTSELDFSLVVTTYGVGDKTLGSLGILGPSRMEYSRASALVNYLGTTLSDALTLAAGNS
jgi:heat-inducible transcriptional repressor